MQSYRSVPTLVHLEASEHNHLQRHPAELGSPVLSDQVGSQAMGVGGWKGAGRPATGSDGV